MFLETVSNPTKEEMNSFNAETPYPSVITRIYSESVGENDCNVIFVFLISNGYILKEIKHICTNVFTSDRQHFKEFCEALLFNSDWSEYDSGKEEWGNYKETFDLNDTVGLGVILHVANVNHHSEVQKICQCYFSEEEYFGWDFDTIFDNADEDNFKSEIPKKINRLIHELFNDNTIKCKDIFVDDEFPFD